VKHVIPVPARLTCKSGNPRASYAAWRLECSDAEALLLVQFEFTPDWLDPADPQDLTALYCVRGDSVHVAVTDSALVADGSPPFEQYTRWVRQHRLASFDVEAPIELQPVSIAKPWGREIWYTAVESRGVCWFTTGGGCTPIPWLQAALPSAQAGSPGEALVLLKVLDPSPEPVQGDLYFELHLEKREVYVVTAIDRRAWPDGVGYIRYGFNPGRLAEYPGEDAFRTAYLEAVLAYEAVRRAVDLVRDGGSEPSGELLSRERRLREAMDDFTCLRPLQVGDVVKIPPLFPHALQHGVRTVEFQTPSYERKILSFAQKVLTQDRWDTREAVEKMRLGLPSEQPACSRIDSCGVQLEHIVDFPDFEVHRVTIPPGVHWRVVPLPSYSLVMVLSGQLALAGTCYGAERALLLPRRWEGALAAAKTDQPLVFLWAAPRG